MTRLVLGSASAGRLQVLRAAGVEPTVLVSGIDEDALIAGLGPDADPPRVTAALAEAKADRVAQLLPPEVSTDCVVVGCDSMLHIDGRLVGKPPSVAEARRRWQAMAGRSGELLTGHALLRLRDHAVVGRAVATATTTVRFGTPTDEDLDAYLASGEPLRVAGGFTLDGLGGWFVDGVDGDPSSVVGISLPMLRRLLAEAGVSIAELWGGQPAALSRAPVPPAPDRATRGAVMPVSLLAPSPTDR